jgi:ArsR family transcriptional regulator
MAGSNPACNGNSTADRLDWVNTATHSSLFVFMGWILAARFNVYTRGFTSARGRVAGCEGFRVSLDGREDSTKHGDGKGQSDSQLAAFAENAADAAAFLKALSHEGRLMILCSLSLRELSVTELEQILGSRQAAVSQQLARLRLEGLVSTRRDGKAVYYSISDPKVGRVIALIRNMFCDPD